MSTVIHPTALISADAKIGDDVRDRPVRDRRRGLRRSATGACSAARTVLERNVILAPRVKIGIGSILGGDPQDLKFKGERTTVEIGEDTTIREYVTINRGTASRSRRRSGRTAS